MTHWSARLAQKRMEKKLSVRELARRTNVGHDMIYKWERGEVDNPRDDQIRPVMKALSISKSWLMHGIEDTADGHALPVQSVPLVRLEDLVAMRKSFAGKDKIGVPAGIEEGAFGVTVEDSSMAPDGIAAGDIVIVGSSAPPVPGKIVVAIVQGRPLIRRYRPTSATSHAGAILVASNDVFPTETMRKSDRIVGQVILHVRRM